MESIPQPGKSMPLEECLNQPGGNLQVFTLLGQNFCGYLNCLGPVGGFGVSLPVPLAQHFLLPTCFFQHIEVFPIANVLARWIGPRNRLEDGLNIDDLLNSHSLSSFPGATAYAL